MKITEETIPLIEKALGIQLYEPQKQYLLGETAYFGPNRGAGRTLAHCIDLALNDGYDYEITDHSHHRGKIRIRGVDPIDTRKMERYCDYGDGSIRYARGYYRRMFLDIWHLLKDAGLSVRELIR